MSMNKYGKNNWLGQTLVLFLLRLQVQYLTMISRHTESNDTSSRWDRLSFENDLKPWIQEEFGIFLAISLSGHCKTNCAIVDNFLTFLALIIGLKYKRVTVCLPWPLRTDSVSSVQVSESRSFILLPAAVAEEDRTIAFLSVASGAWLKRDETSCYYWSC